MSGIRDAEPALRGDGFVMKTCEYCGSNVPDVIFICPNCAAHFPEAPGWGTVDENGVEWPAPAPRPFGLQMISLDHVFKQIGRTVAGGCLLYVFMMFLGSMFMGLMGREVVLLAALALICLAVYLVRKAY